MIDPGENTGFIIVEPRPDENHIGAETSVIGVNNAASNWGAFLPPSVWQKLIWTTSKGVTASFESDACVSFSAGQTLATFGAFCVAMDLWPADVVAWLKTNGFILPNGQFSISARYIAKMSNTTINGNSMPNVWDSIAEYGLVPDALWPMPTPQIEALDTATQTFQTEAWNTYYAEVPENVQLLGKQFAAMFKLDWEWVSSPAAPMSRTQLEATLTSSPIQIATAVCSPWNTAAPINGCGPGAQHATMLYAENQVGDYEIFDHYVPFQKLLAPNYNITYATRATITPVSTEPVPPFHYTFTKQLTFNAASNDPVELQNLQAALQYLGYMQRGVYGLFGPQTKTALAAFQTTKGIKDPSGQGVDFGPSTRTALNAALVVKQ